MSVSRYILGIGRYQGQADISYRLSTADKISDFAITLTVYFLEQARALLLFICLVYLVFAMVFL